MDVSSWQRKINWSLISARTALVICKASEGDYFADPNFAVNWKGVKERQIRRGAYHYFNPSINPVRQFDKYYKAVEAAGGFQPSDLAPALDVEGLEAASTAVRRGAAAGIKEWLELAHSWTGKWPVLYTSKYQWDFVRSGHDDISAWCSQYPLWVAWYPYEPDKSKAPPRSAIPTGWDKWAIWQYARNGQINGINTDVDLNILSNWFASQLEQPTDTPVPVPTPSEPKPAPSTGSGVEYVGTVISPNGLNVRERPLITSKRVGTLLTGTKIHGYTAKVKSSREAWLEIKEPVRGWCAIVYDGVTLISIDS